MRGGPGVARGRGAQQDRLLLLLLVLVVVVLFYYDYAATTTTTTTTTTTITTTITIIFVYRMIIDYVIIDNVSMRSLAGTPVRRPPMAGTARPTRPSCYYFIAQIVISVFNHITWNYSILYYLMLL